MVLSQVEPDRQAGYYQLGVPASPGVESAPWYADEGLVIMLLLLIAGLLLMGVGALCADIWRRVKR